MTAETETQQQLDLILDREIDAARRLAEVLNSENAAIGRRELAALEQAITDKQAGLQRLEELNRERGLLVASQGFATDKAGMESCLKWCDTTGLLTGKWRQLLSVADNCRTQNRMNRQLMDMGSRHIHHALCILRGEDPDQNLYGPGGDNIAPHASRDLATA